MPASALPFAGTRRYEPASDPVGRKVGRHTQRSLAQARLCAGSSITWSTGPTCMESFVYICQCLVDYDLERGQNAHFLSVRHMIVILRVIAVAEGDAIKHSTQVYAYHVTKTAVLSRDALRHETIDQQDAASSIDANYIKVVTQFELGDNQESFRAGLGKCPREAVSNNLHGTWGKLFVTVVPRRVDLARTPSFRWATVNQLKGGPHVRDVRMEQTRWLLNRDDRRAARYGCPNHAENAAKTNPVYVHLVVRPMKSRWRN